MFETLDYFCATPHGLKKEPEGGESKELTSYLYFVNSIIP